MRMGIQAACSRSARPGRERWLIDYRDGTPWREIATSSGSAAARIPARTVRQERKCVAVSVEVPSASLTRSSCCACPAADPSRARRGQPHCCGARSRSAEVERDPQAPLRLAQAPDHRRGGRKVRGLVSTRSTVPGLGGLIIEGRVAAIAQASLLPAARFVAPTARQGRLRVQYEPGAEGHVEQARATRLL
jgi:hypothetical protein